MSDIPFKINVPEGGKLIVCAVNELETEGISTGVHLQNLKGSIRILE